MERVDQLAKNSLTLDNLEFADYQTDQSNLLNIIKKELKLQHRQVLEAMLKTDKKKFYLSHNPPILLSTPLA